MNHPIITKPLLDLVINQLEKYNEALESRIGNLQYFPYNHPKESCEAEIKVNDDILKQLYELKEVKY